MSHQSRILPLLGPAAVLYLVADLASLSGGLRWASTLMAVVAFAVTLAPLLVRSLGAAAGRRRVGYLGIATGLALLGWVMPQAEVMSVQIASAIGAVSAGGLVLDLATSVPDRIRGGRSFRPLFPLGALVAGLLGISAFLPPIEIADEILLVSSRLRFAPLIFSAACVLLATALRLARAPLGSGAEDRASNLWGILGLFPVAALVLAALALRVGGWQEPAPELLQTALATVTLFGVYGHVALVDARRRLHASRAARRALSALITVCLLGALAAWLRPPLPTNGGAWTITIVLVLLGAMLSYRVSAPLVRRVLSPYGGRLLLALDAATRALPGATTLEELGQAILPPIRKGSGALDAEPALFVAAPALEVRIDAAGVSHLRQRALPPAILERILARPGELIATSLLEARVVREPQLKALVEALLAADALCVLPLGMEGEHEGALLIPRGARRTPLSLEELSALERVAKHLFGAVTILSAQLRAQAREAERIRERDRAEERLEVAEEELARLRQDHVVLRAGRGVGRERAPAVAYSAAMRRLQEAILEAAPHEAPVLIRAEGGVPVDQIARALHEASARADGPFIVADCSAASLERGEAELFGDDAEGAPGWLRLAHGGTLLLADLPALSSKAQRDLAEALATRSARAIGGAGNYPIDVRLVGTSRVDLSSLVGLGALDPELARWFSPLVIEAPPLRDRREDIPSLILLGLSRACRVLGRSAIGIEPAAVERLVAYDWPGNLRELQHVLDRAVARSEGSQVGAQDLPPLRGEACSSRPAAQPASAEDPLDGTFAEIEGRILGRALARADGNKSEAARLLGLKRTTFLDKLRRVGPEGGGESAA